jgi:biopolymer transport protein TolR
MNITHRKRRKPMAEINVVPYIDVMLVLLVIFMVTAPLQQQGVEIDLPVTQGNLIEQKEKSNVIISIKKQGQYYLSENGAKAIAVSRDELILKVVELYQKKPQLQVYIRGDKNVSYGHVVSIMASLKQSGVARIGLMTTPEE